MNRGRRVLSDICAAVASVLLIVAMLIVSIEMFALNTGFYESEYRKLHTAQSIGISEEDLSAVTEKLIGYTVDTQDSLDMQAEINGEMQEVFGQREKDHMVDVKLLYLGVRDTRTWCLVGALVLFALSVLLRREDALLRICRNFLRVSVGFVVIVGALTIYAMVDFSSFWISFHHLFFTNDLWLLNPETDVLIMMVPQQFFSDLVMRIIIRFISIFVALNAAASVGLSLISKRRKQADKEVKEA